jgi:hypothetical protein
MSYATAAVRSALYGGRAPDGAVLAGASTSVSLAVLVVFALATVVLAARVCETRR